MTEARLRSLLSLVLVAGHICILGYVVVLAGLDRFDFEELKMAFAVVIPLFAAHTAAIVRFQLGDADGVRASDIGALRVFDVTRSILFLAFPVSFVAFLVAITSWKAFGTLPFRHFVTLLGVTETGLGLYVGMIVGHFFGMPKGKGGSSVRRGAGIA